MLPHKSIEVALQKVVAAILPGVPEIFVLVRPCPDPKFGDYQTNALMGLAKERKLNPRQFATDVVARLDVTDVCEQVEIAGAGFLNFRLKPAALVAALQSAARGEYLFFEKTAQPRTVVIDFSSPNVAKPMHVGHIRSTILGDALARTLRLLGHKVITDNHIGDWGTQFGMLIVGWKRYVENEKKVPSDIEILVEIYRGIQAEIKAQLESYTSTQNPTPGMQTLTPISLTEIDSRLELVKLQAGDEENSSIWNEMIRISQVQFDTIYKRLGVTFDYTYGESFYKDKVQRVYNELINFKIAVESEGALVIFQNEANAPANIKGHPFIIRKSDGASNYASTDLATVLYRKEEWNADKVLYVVDSRQRDHFDHLFFTVHKWFTATKRNPPELKLIEFGAILGDDNKPLKTRTGDNVKLRDLLDEAEDRAFKIVSDKNPELPEVQRREIARIVGLGAVKYADLSPNRQSDYVFSWDKMLALNGNTAPYLQYAYARIRSIFRKAASDSPDGWLAARQTPLAETALVLSAPAEFALAKHLLNFGLVLEAVAEEFRPNFLCNYLYELAGHFGRFYENCPVLKAEPAERASRLVLCELSARVLKAGLEILGIETLEQM
jgi:arginyl-tRNA synthetase